MWVMMKSRHGNRLRHSRMVSAKVKTLTLESRSELGRHKASWRLSWLLFTSDACVSKSQHLGKESCSNFSFIFQKGKARIGIIRIIEYWK